MSYNKKGYTTCARCADDGAIVSYWATYSGLRAHYLDYHPTETPSQTYQEIKRRKVPTQKRERVCVPVFSWDE